MDIAPEHFLCPISREVMREAVTIATGVSYDRKNIERWLFGYKNKTCPATMQPLTDLQITPNHTLQRLILLANPPPTSVAAASDLADLISAIESSPFKATPLRTLRLRLAASDDLSLEIARSARAVGVLVRTLYDAAVDFAAFRAAEEAVAVLRLLPPASAAAEALSSPESVRSLAAMLRRASSETRLHALTILREQSTGIDWGLINQRLGSDLLKALLELASDEIGTKAGPAAMDVMTEILRRSKKARPRAVEAGAVTVLVELLPDSGRARCECVLNLLRLLCGCAEGRLALADHGMGVAAVTTKSVGVSAGSTRLAVKIISLVCYAHPGEKVLEEMALCGTVKKLLALLHVQETQASSSTRDKLVNILKLHARFWSRYPCIPSNHLALLN